MLKQERPTNLFSSIGFLSIFAAFGFAAQPEIIKMCHGDFSPEVYVPLILKGSAGVAGSAGLMHYDPMLYTSNGIAGRNQDQAIGNLNRIRQTPVSVELPKKIAFSNVSSDATIRKAAKDVATIAKDALAGDVVGAVTVALSNTNEMVEAASEVRAIAKEDVSSFEKANGIANKIGAFAGGVLGVGIAAFKGLTENIAVQPVSPIHTIDLLPSNVSAESMKQIVAAKPSNSIEQITTDTTLASEVVEALIPNDIGAKNVENAIQEGESILKIASNPTGSLLSEIENAKF